MRLARDRSQSDSRSLIVGVVTPTGLSVESDLEQLFIEAYHRLHGRLLDRAERFFDREEARDVEADAVADVWQRWPYLRPDQRTDAYFFRALHNCVIDAIRTRHPNVSLEDAEDELDLQAARSAEMPSRADTAAEVLDLALATMSRRRREVLLLIREERLTYNEVGEVLGLSEGTINRHYRLAMDHIRAAFTRAGFRIADFKPARLPSSERGATND